MRETKHTHYMRLHDLKTACGKKAREVMYSTWFTKMVTCPACKTQLEKRK